MSILTRTPRLPASAIVCAVSERGGSNLHIRQLTGIADGREKERRRTWEVVREIPIRHRPPCTPHLGEAQSERINRCSGGNRRQLTECAETAPGKLLCFLFDGILDLGRWVRQAQNADQSLNVNKIKRKYSHIRVWCTFRSGIAMSSLLHLSSNAFRNRIKWCEPVCNPAPLRECQYHQTMYTNIQHTFRFSLALG